MHPTFGKLCSRIHAKSLLKHGKKLTNLFDFSGPVKLVILRVSYSRIVIIMLFVCSNRPTSWVVPLIIRKEIACAERSDCSFSQPPILENSTAANFDFATIFDVVITVTSSVYGVR